MMFRRFLFLIPMIFAVSSVGLCGSYHVSLQGDDTNTGAAGQAWRTIGKANNVVGPGDTVFVHAGSYAEAIHPAANGEPGRPIVFKNFPGDSPIFTAFDGVTLTSGASYVVIDGMVLQGNDTGVRLEHASNITVKNCSIIGSKGWQAVRISNATYCRILNNYVDRQDPKDGYGENGDGIALVDISTNNLIDGNTVTGCYHVGITSAYGGQSRNVIRNNRCFMLHTGYSLQNGTSGNLFERNVAYYVGKVRNDWGGHTLQLTGNRNIVRYNVLYDDTSGGVGHNVYEIVSYYAVDEFGQSYDVRDNRTAQNTFYGESDETYEKMLFRLSNWGNATVVSGNQFKNNVFVKGASDEVAEDASNGQVGGFASLYDGNIVRRNVSGEVVIGFYGTDFVLNLSLADAKSRRPAIWLSGNLGEDPRFVNIVGQGPAKNFALQSGSPAIDAGVPLTVTTNAGSNSTVLTVADAGWFCDGFGVIDGDSIQIGGRPAVQIAAVDYTNNTITLASPTSWASGSRVDYAFSGLRPDIGAIEYRGTLPAPNTIPVTPTLLAPPPSATDQPTDIELRWSSVTDARNYVLEVASDSAFGTIVMRDSTQADTSLQLSSLDNNHAYFWHVCASNILGSSSFSSPRRFTTGALTLNPPSHTSMPNGILNQPTVFRLSWSASNGATSYDLQLSSDSVFRAIVVDDSGIVGTSRRVGPLEYNKSYFYHLRSRNGASISRFGPTYRFTTARNGALPPEIPRDYVLEQNYPNPFNPVTRIHYGLPHDSHVRLQVFNLLGQLVATLVDGQQGAGQYDVKFDASRLASGLYFYMFKTDQYFETRRMLLVR